MSDRSRHRLLVVDDDQGVRESMAMLLTAAGYEISTAKNGLDALLHLRKFAPDVIISDLAMPQMSGFEFLSVVRRRFPDIPIVAASGAYDCGNRIPDGIPADAFYAKGENRPEELLHTVAELIRSSNALAISHRRKSIPIWIPANGEDSNGLPLIVLTCSECLRSFSPCILYKDAEIQETFCRFCANPIRYIIDFSHSVSAPKHDIATEFRSKQLQMTEP